MQIRTYIAPGKSGNVASRPDGAQKKPQASQPPEKEAAMNGIDDKAIADHLKSTLELADQMIMSAGQDANGAFLKAIGTLAQVIFITVVDEQHKRQSAWLLTNCALT